MCLQQLKPGKTLTFEKFSKLNGIPQIDHNGRERSFIEQRKGKTRDNSYKYEYGIEKL